jgi:hypothetical protein
MKYSCESCVIPEKVCDRHHDCIADVWYAALKSAERRKTVRSKRPAQQRKEKSLLCAVPGLKCSFDILGKCSNGSACPWQRKPSAVA